eukprot:46181-Amorphochlora_amoeboformis.AAC.1
MASAFFAPALEPVLLWLLLLLRLVNVRDIFEDRERRFVGRGAYFTPSTDGSGWAADVLA